MPNQHREDEKRRREAAHATTNEVEPGGHEIAGRSIKQMVSVRLEAQLLKDLRELSEKHGASISDLLREAAVDLVARSRWIPVRMQYELSEAAAVITTVTSRSEITSGVFTPHEGPQPVSC